MTDRRGHHAIVEQFVADGHRYMFGNPGTVEQGFLQALDDFPEVEYILTLQETVAAGIADGYARATGRPALLQLHSGVGLGNGIGMLYQSMRGHTPLVCVVGESGVSFDAMDAQMAVDLVAMAKPVTKWSTRVVDRRSVLRVLRRAQKIASTPPCGPVLVVLPADVLDAVNEEPVRPTVVPDTRVVPSPDALADAGQALARSRRPVILVGDGVASSGAQQELVDMAELLGAVVYGVNSSETNMDMTHPLWGGFTGHMFGEHSSSLVADADAVLIVGTYVFPDVYPDLADPFESTVSVVHIDLDTYEIGKNYRVDHALLGDPKATLAALVPFVADAFDAQRAAQAVARLEAARTVDRPVTLGHPVAEAFVGALAAALPDDYIVFDESLTMSPVLLRHIPARVPGDHFMTRGGSLGVGFPGAIGAKLARPDATVVGISGDGGSMYTIQSLWTAHRYGIAAKFVVVNNGRYQLLVDNLAQYRGTQGMFQDRPVPASFSLDPAVDFVAVARGMHVPGVRLHDPVDAPRVVREMLDAEGPFLVELVVQ